MAINLRKFIAEVAGPQLEAKGFEFDEEHSDVFHIAYSRRVGRCTEHLAFRSSIHRDSLDMSLSTNFDTSGTDLSDLLGLQEFYWKFDTEPELDARLKEVLGHLERSGLPWLAAHGSPQEGPRETGGFAPPPPPAAAAHPGEVELELAADAAGAFLPVFIKAYIENGAVNFAMGERSGTDGGKASFRMAITYHQLRSLMEFLNQRELEFRVAYPEGPPAGFPSQITDQPPA